MKSALVMLILSAAAVVGTGATAQADTAATVPQPTSAVPFWPWRP
ncbi:hypothetical protein [Actinokineospora pegani]|nr:hypothetical protein [Actinokineospora pegani]